MFSTRSTYAVIVGIAALILALAWWRAPALFPRGGGRGPAQADGADRQGGTLRPAVVTPEHRTAEEPRDVGAAAAQDRRKAARLMDPAVPVELRLAAIDALAGRGDASSVRQLMELAGESSPLRAAAMEALGRCPSPEVASFLKGALAQSDPLVLAAAVRSLGRVAGASAIDAIGETLRSNHRRDDGFEDTVCGACVETLGAIGARAAVPLLVAELDQTVGRELQHEYGSQIVAALRSVGDASARPVLQQYADRLWAEKEMRKDNPLAQKYFDQKMAEVAAAVDSLK